VLASLALIEFRRIECSARLVDETHTSFRNPRTAALENCPPAGLKGQSGGVDVNTMSSVAPSTKLSVDASRARTMERIQKLIVAMIVGFGTLAMLGRAITLVRLLNQPGTCVGDFSAFVNGWHIARTGGRGLYDVAVQARGFEHTTCTNWGENFPLFVNPPHVALLGWPLGHSSMIVSYIVWALITFACATFVLVGANRYLKTWSRTARALFTFAVISSPVLTHLGYLGALSFFVAGGTMTLMQVLATPMPVVATPSATNPEKSPARRSISRSNRHQWFAAIGMAAVSIKPQYFLFFAAALVGLRLWQIIVRTGAIMTVLFVAPSLIFGWDTWPKYLSMLSAYTSRDGKNGLDIHSMVNIRSVFAHVFGSGPTADSAATIVFIAGVGGVGYLAHRAFISNLHHAGITMLFSLVSTLAVIASPHTNVQDIVVAIPAIAVALRFSPPLVRSVLVGLGLAMTVNGPRAHANSARLFAFSVTVVLVVLTVSELRATSAPRQPKLGSTPQPTTK
jgi:Glycosyltransferase family 87